MQTLSRTPGSPSADTSVKVRPVHLLGYLLLGMLFGWVLVRSEAVSWFRIQEMFRFQSFHMYGILGSAVAVSAVATTLVRRFDPSTPSGAVVRVPPKDWGDSRIPGARYWIGGIFFGMGWALLGACPGPMLALLGSGITVMVMAILAALAGTWTYALVRPHLPH